LINMSLFVDEIIHDLRTNPHNWKDFNGMGVYKDAVTVYGALTFLWWFISLISVNINDKDMPISFFDKIRLELAIKRWYRSSSIHRLKQ